MLHPEDAGGVAGELHCLQQSRDAVESAEYWQELCPRLRCSGGDRELPPPLALPEERLGDLRQQLQQDGFFVLPPEELRLPDCCDVEALRDAATELRDRGWQATFLTMYDEPWLLARHLRDVITAAAGGPNLLNSDWLGYHVLPPTEAGMPPHRDFEHCPPSSWHDEERTLPKVVTVWVALSDCGPENSCLYFLPARCDAGYRREGGGVGEDATDVFLTNPSFQDIVCCPMRRGSCVIFTHRVFHWGSSSTPQAREPRIALAFGASDARFKAPYIDPRHYPLPPLSLRLALNAAQMLIYNKRHEGPWPLSDSLTRDMKTLLMLFDVFKRHLAEFDETYARTVFSSPVLPALQEHAQAGPQQLMAFEI